MPCQQGIAAGWLLPRGPWPAAAAAAGAACHSHSTYGVYDDAGLPTLLVSPRHRSSVLAYQRTRSHAVTMSCRGLAV
jgi:hypothetical protein